MRTSFLVLYIIETLLKWLLFVPILCMNESDEMTYTNLGYMWKLYSLIHAYEKNMLSMFQYDVQISVFKFFMRIKSWVATVRYLGCGNDLAGVWK